MSDTTPNDSFSKSPMNIEGKCRILVELWDSYQDYDDFDFSDLISYGDKLGVYDLSMAVAYGEFEITEAEESVVNEFFVMFLAHLGLKDELDFADLDDVLISRQFLLPRGETE